MKDGKHDYTYASMMKHQLDPIIEELKKNPDSRQCIIELHSPEDYKNMGGKKRIPCSLEYIFQIRKNAYGIPKLNISYTMRSCDFYSHFRNDIWLACELRDYIANKIDVQSGMFTMFIASLHMYKKDWEQGVY
jgi:thymidylate synthase